MSKKKLSKEELLMLKGKAFELWEFCHEHLRIIEEKDPMADCLKSCPLRKICDDNRIHDLEYEFDFRKNMKEKNKIEKAYKIIEEYKEGE